MREERKLTLRNHIELFADELTDIWVKLRDLIKDINAIQNEWIDDDVLEDMIALQDDVHTAEDAAWALENRLEKCEFGKRRF